MFGIAPSCNLKQSGANKSKTKCYPKQSDLQKNNKCINIKATRPDERESAKCVEAHNSKKVKILQEWLFIFLYSLISINYRPSTH